MSSRCLRLVARGTLRGLREERGIIIYDKRASVNETLASYIYTCISVGILAQTDVEHAPDFLRRSSTNLISGSSPSFTPVAHEASVGSKNTEADPCMAERCDPARPPPTVIGAFGRYVLLEVADKRCAR